ncbi:hypothetical protein PINS_up014507 [Pythium insidiosum]|nr:hypothetical protein PINS_up014507 [Pythium insidiosum]
MWPKLWPHAASPVSVVQFRGQRVHVKRDDVFHLAGNKLRKLYWFLQQDASFFSDKHLVSFGGTQSNAMLAIAQVAHETKTPFTYFSRALACDDPSEGRLADGNLAHALALGMRHIQLRDEEYHTLAETREMEALCRAHCRQHETPLIIPQGAAFQYAEDGVKVLAQELNTYCATWKMPPDERLQAAASTTAATAIHGCLTMEILASTSIEFDLLYAAFAWQTIMEPSNLEKITERSTTPRELLYIHTGGVSGNATMLARYARKAKTSGRRWP